MASKTNIWSPCASRRGRLHHRSPGPIFQGDTHEEALANIREAIRAYLEELGSELNPTEAEVEVPTVRARA